MRLSKLAEASLEFNALTETPWLSILLLQIDSIESMHLGKKDDVCYCEKCKHEKASECLEIPCNCCKKEDEIRLRHPILADESNQEEEREKNEDEKYREGRRDAFMTDMGGIVGSGL